MVLQRWEPFRELRQMEDTMNRLWRGFAGTPVYRDESEGWNIAMDVIQKKTVTSQGFDTRNKAGRHRCQHRRQRPDAEGGTQGGGRGRRRDLPGSGAPDRVFLPGYQPARYHRYRKDKVELRERRPDDCDAQDRGKEEKTDKGQRIRRPEGNRSQKLTLYGT